MTHKKKFNEYVKELIKKSDTYETISSIKLSKFTENQMYSLMDLADRELALWNTLQKNEPNKTAKEIYKIVISGNYHSTSLLDTIKDYQSE